MSKILWIFRLFTKGSKWQNSCFLKNHTPKISSKTKVLLAKKLYLIIYTKIFTLWIKEFMDFSLRSKWQIPLNFPNSPNQPTPKKFSPHCNKNYDFSFTFLLNFANFYSSSGENSLKFRKFLSNFRKSAKFSHAQSPILPPL